VLGDDGAKLSRVDVHRPSPRLRASARGSARGRGRVAMPLLVPPGAAAMLGVSGQRVQQLVSRSDFPKPDAVLAMGKVWPTADVEEWARAHGRLGE
jgi:predicted DNA-binding transcriptional regulator AlpA